MAAYLIVNSANIIYGCLHTRIETISLVVLCPNDGLPGNNCYQAIFGIKRSAIIFPLKW